MKNKFKYGDGTFTPLMYKGKPLILDELNGCISGVTYFNHIYQMRWRSDTKCHACLKNGYWCWSNLLTNPTDLVAYLQNLWSLRHSK